MDICQEITIDYEYEKSKLNYVFAALNPDPNSMYYQDNEDYFDWLFSCSCYYKPDENISIPDNNLFNPVWYNEKMVASKFDKICRHIKICYLARCVERNHIFDTTYPVPKWVKYYIGDNYIEKSHEIISDLKPIRWGNNTMRHGIGKVKVYDYDEYIIKQYKNNIWTCTCNGFLNNGYCKHIVKIRNKHMALQNRRELCIRLAHYYFENNN